MESSSTGIGRLDCYEDMFKEITRKLYGEDPDHRTSSVQNEFETSVSYKNEEDTGNGTDCSEDGKWTLDDEPLEGTEGSRIAAYRAATSTWRCYECGDCMGGGPREVAEHFVELHSSRIIGEESSRGRLHSSRKDYLSSGDLKLEDVVTYLERVRDRAERLAPPTRRTQETQTVPAALLPVSSTFLLQELPTSPPQHLHQNSVSIPGNTTSSGGGGGGGGGNSGGSTGGGGGGGVGGNNASGKRYTCLYCPYGTDRRDLYTRHENIHREEKPFHCYVCYKPFSRADHVKKHFLRMHREHTYELSRIRRPAGSTSSTPKPPSSVQSTDSNANSNLTLSSNNSSNNNTQNSASPYPVNSIYSSPKQQQQQQQPLPISTSSTYQLQPQAVNNVHATSAALYQAATLAAAAAANVSNIMQQQQQQPDANCSTVPLPVVVPQTNPSVRRLSNGGCNTKSPHKSGSGGSSKANQERRYTCCYCSWSGVDNWCLKRHLNTHLKPFACALCEYKAARAERLATHVLKVHNRRQCSRCSFLAEDLIQLQVHQLHVHRVSNASVAAAAAAAASATAQGNAQQNQSNERQQQSHQPQPIHPVGGGRPPPGPPVFPASSAAIAPATTVIPPTTILGNRSEIASMPDSPCSVQESSSCEERFRLANHEHRRSRKQSMPRKIMTPIDNDAEIEISDEETETMHHQQESNSDPTSTKDSTPRPLLRCFLCPLEAPARAFRTRPYHTRESLMLHKLWRHTKQLSKRAGKENRSPARAATAAASLTLKATLVTGRVFRYQR